LISEWLRHGRRIFSDDEFTLCNNIRTVAAKLFTSAEELWLRDLRDFEKELDSYRER